MKFVLISIGTRGDMEPFLAIAEILHKNGHQVICGFPDQFQTLARDAGVDFFSLGKKFIELIEGPDGKAVMGGGLSFFRKIAAYIRLSFRQNDINKELVKKQFELIAQQNPDRVIYNGKATYPILWGISHPGQTILISPVPYLHYVRDHAHVALNGNFGWLLNKLTYGLANFGIVTTAIITKRWLKIPARITYRQVKKALLTGRTIYTISPVLFKRPEYWSENLQVLGYHERNKSKNWQPNQALIDFLAVHDKILFITFGSMINPEPGKKTAIFLDILGRLHIPAIINTAAGGLTKPQMFESDHIYFVSQIPYDWIFSKIYAVIHHGGAGTTHTALKNGCPSLIIPHIIDQFVWNDIVKKTSCGPGGISIKKISPKSLQPLILDLWQNPVYRIKAQEIAGQMQKEDLREPFYKALVS